MLLLCKNCFPKFSTGSRGIVHPLFENFYWGHFFFFFTATSTATSTHIIYYLVVVVVFAYLFFFAFSVSDGSFCCFVVVFLSFTLQTDGTTV